MHFSDLPHVPLLDGPTPLHRLHRIEQRQQRSGLYAKRDDQMRLGLGGNKLRSLELWLGAALAEEADLVIVAGAPASNQCRLTAAAAAFLGLECIVLYDGSPPPIETGNLLLTRLFGAKIRFLGPVDEDQRALAAEREAERHRLMDRTPHIIGDPVLGAVGYVHAALELHAQSQAMGADIRHVFLPGSMGPTEAGLVFGNAMLGQPFRVHLVSVEYERAELEARVRRIYDGLAAMTGCEVPDFALAPIEYHMAQLGQGYGIPTHASEQAILTFARLEAIVLEHTYTAKTAAAFLEATRASMLQPDEPACFLHTGGIPALFGQAGLFTSLGTG